jgi:hypothetical protein
MLFKKELEEKKKNMFAPIGQFLNDRDTLKQVKNILGLKLPNNVYDDICDYWKKVLIEFESSFSLGHYKFCSKFSKS